MSSTSTTPVVSSGGRGKRKIQRTSTLASESSAALAASSSSQQQRTSSGKWELGQKVEACDTVGNWYPAKVVELKEDEMRIHFQRWSSRYDQWFPLVTSLVRRKKENVNKLACLSIKPNDRVLAKWTDNNYYPAKVSKLVGLRQCHVIFDDGIRMKMRVEALQPLPSDYAGEAVPPKEEKPLPGFQVDASTNHNQFMCDQCKKGFRKESLLASHMKHYHNQVSDTPLDPIVGYETRIRERRSRELSKEDTAGSSGRLSGRSTPDSGPRTTIKEEVKEESENMGVKLRLNLASLLKDSVEVCSSSEDTVINENYVERETETPTPTLGKRKRGGDRRSQSALSQHHAKRTKLDEGGYPYYYHFPAIFWKKPKGNNALSYFDARKTRDEHENDNIEEVVKCVCSYMEENGLMVQCELCLTWQHALCMGYKHESDVPSHGYFCPFCRNPDKPTLSQRGCHQLNHWLKAALEPGFTPIHFKTKAEEEAEASARKQTSRNEESLDSTVNDDFDLTFTPSSSLNDEQRQSTQSDPMITASDQARKSSFGLNDFGEQAQVMPAATNDADRIMDVMHNLDFSQAQDANDNEMFARQVKATNQLATVMHDVVRLLHTLDFKIHNESSPLAIAEIREKQRNCRDLLHLIESKLELLEDEIERRELADNQMSASTNTAPSSPIHFGSEVWPVSTPVKDEKPSTITPETVVNSPLFQALSSPNKLVPSSSPAPSTMVTILKPMITTAATKNAAATSQPPASSMLPPLASTSTSLESHPPQYPPDVLSRLIISRLPKEDGSEPTEAEEDELERQLLAARGPVRPSLSHSYLPANSSETQVKLEIAYLFKDLEVARKIVLSI